MTGAPRNPQKTTAAQAVTWNTATIPGTPPKAWASANPQKVVVFVMV